MPVIAACKTQAEITTELSRVLNDALPSFGTYAYDDKGPDEVMSTEPLVKGLKMLSEPLAAGSLAAFFGFGVREATLAARLAQDMSASFQSAFEVAGGQVEY